MSKKRSLVTNASYLMVLHFSSVLLPLLSIPYVLRTIGPSNFGYIAIAFSFLTIIEIIVDWGFQLPASQYVSANRRDNNRLSQVLGFLTVIKLLIYLFCILIIFLCGIVGILDSNVTQLIYIGSLAMLGRIIFPHWFFQGIEKLKLVATIQIISRFVVFGCLFIFVNKGSSLALIQFLLNGGVFLGAIMTIPFLLKEVNLTKFSLSEWESLTPLYLDSWSLFKVQAITLLYSRAYLPVSSMFLNIELMGFLVIADRYCRSALSLMYPVCAAVHPRIAYLIVANRSEAIILGLKVTLVCVVISLIGVILFNLNISFFLDFIFKNNESLFVSIFSTMSLISLPLVISECLKNFFFQPLGMSNYLVNSYMLGAIIFILGFVILIVTDNAPSGIFLLVAVESLIALTLMTLLLIRHSQRRLV